MPQSPALVKYFESRLDNLDPVNNASEYNASLLAFVQLSGEASVKKIAPLARSAPARNTRFFEETLRNMEPLSSGCTADTAVSGFRWQRINHDRVGIVVENSRRAGRSGKGDAHAITTTGL